MLWPTQKPEMKSGNKMYFPDIKEEKISILFRTSQKSKIVDFVLSHQ